MALLSKCDWCGTLGSAANPMHNMQGGRRNCEYLNGDDIQITILIPWNNDKDGHVCDTCWRDSISSRFADLCGMLTPYHPSRTPGLVQGHVVKAMPDITEGDLQLLGRLRGLLLAGE